MRFPRSALSLAVVALLPLAGCSDSETPPGSLTGIVTEADGTPIAGARINLGYTVTLNADTLAVPPLSASVGPLTIGCDSTATLTVLDHLDRVIWTWTLGDSCDEVAWDGTNEDGEFVPDGPYRYVLETQTTGGVKVLEHWIILVDQSLPRRSLTAVATADAAGIFEIPYPEIPIWKGYPVSVSGPDGVESGDAVFENTFQVYAFRGDGSTAHAQATVTVENRYRSTQVELILP
jgi:hypothetical protein